MARPAPDPVYLLRGSDSPITSLKFLHDGEILASGNLNGTVQFWDLTTYRSFRSFVHDSGSSVLWIEELITGALITQSRNGTVKMWSQKNGDYINTGSMKSASMGFCSGACFQENSNCCLLAIPSPDGQSHVDILDTKNNATVAKFKPSQTGQKQGMCMAIKPANVNQILIGYESGTVFLWDFTAGKVLDILKVCQESVMCMDYTNSKNIGISGSSETLLSTWTIESDAKLKKMKDIEITNPGVNDILMRNDQKIFATAGWDSRVRIFSVKSLKPLAVLTCHSESVQCMAFSEHYILACGSKDKRISLWDIYT